MSDDLRNLHTLGAEEVRRDGPAPHGDLRAGPAVGVPAAARNLPEAPAGGRADGGSTIEVAQAAAIAASLTKRAAAAIIARGPSTLDDLLPLFPNHTRKQVNAAMKNAKRLGWIRVARRGKGLGRSGGTAPSTYAAVVASPSELTIRKERQGEAQFCGVEAWLVMLKEGGRWSAREIAERFGLGNVSGVATNLRAMEHYGTVKRWSRGNKLTDRVRFGVTPDCLVPRGVNVAAILAANAEVCA